MTPFDNMVDRRDIRPRSHIFEKMISGMYLGELTRSVLVSLIDDLLLFDGYSSEKLNTQYALDTAYMSEIESHTKSASAPDSPTRRVLLDELQLDASHVSTRDVETVERVCQFVGKRAARLSAVAISATVIETGHDRDGSDDPIIVGVDGSVIQFYPRS